MYKFFGKLYKNNPMESLAFSVHSQDEAKSCHAINDLDKNNLLFAIVVGGAGKMQQPQQPRVD